MGPTIFKRTICWARAATSGEDPRNYVELTPESLPAHIFDIRRWVRTERDFDYYL